jgi:hypothetical protein
VSSDGLIWPKDGCASIAYAATAAGNPDGMPSFLARQEGPRPPSSAALRLATASASSIASGRTIAIEAAMGATR